MGPFVYHAGLEDACRNAAELGFDAIEIFPPSAAAIDCAKVGLLLEKFQLKLAAVGTGAGWLCQQLTLSSSDEQVRWRANEFVKAIVDVAGRLGAPAIVGSMQGRAPSPMERAVTLEILGDSMREIAHHANHRYGLPLLIEPLNRYETNLLNTVNDAATWIGRLGCDNVGILADLFHMNIEEVDMSRALIEAGSLVRHVHFADSNRRAVGMGHSPIRDAVCALQGMGYTGFLSAEIFPLPDSDSAARQTIDSFRKITLPDKN